MSDLPPMGSDPETVVIDDPDELEMLPRLYLGTYMSTGDVVENDDGTYEAPLILTRPVNLAPVDASAPEMAFPVFRPVGSLVAEPRDDGKYQVSVPDPELYSDSLTEYLDREKLRRAGILNDIYYRCKQTLDEISDTTYEAAQEETPIQNRDMTAMDAFELGKELGKLSVAQKITDKVDSTTDEPQFEYPPTDD